MATLATAEYVSGEPHRAIALAESTSSSLAAPSLAAVTLRRALGQARRAVGDVAGALAAFRDGADIARQLDMPAMAIELDVTGAQAFADDGHVEEALEALRASVAESVAIGSVINEAWARSSLGWVLLRVDLPSALEEIEHALDMSRRIDYPIGVAVNLRSRAFAELILDDIDTARASVAELLDEVVERGAMSHARLVVDVAAVLAHRMGDPSWAQLASTAATLPTPTLVGAGYDLLPLPAGAPIGGPARGHQPLVRLLAEPVGGHRRTFDRRGPRGSKRRRHRSSSVGQCGRWLPRSRRDGPRLQGDGRPRRAARLAAAPSITASISPAPVQRRPRPAR